MKRLTLCLLIGLGVALAALLLATPVHAQDLGPDPSAVPVTEPAPVEETATETAEAPLEPAPALASPAQEAPPPDALAEPAPEVPEAALPIDEALPAEPVTESVAETEPPAEAVDAAAVEVLTETGVTLADEGGAALPAASGGDPYFTVGATIYRFMRDVGPADECLGIPNCVVSATPITAAIQKVALGFIPNDRKIYVESDTYTENVTIDGLAQPLIMQLMGLVGGVDPTSGDPNRTINGDILIQNSSFGFILEGFTINGNVDLLMITGNVTLKNLIVRGNTAGDNAVYVDNTGVVTVEHVDASQNNGRGLVVENPTKYGAVNISNSRFDRCNDPADLVNYTGLTVTTRGAITVTSTTANLNAGNGARLTSTASTVTVRNSSFAGNIANPADTSYGYGLWVESSLLTNIDTVAAISNSRSGLRATSTNSVMLTNILAGSNGLDGISVARPVAESLPDTDWRLPGGTVVTLLNIDADQNTRNGVLVIASNAISATSMDTYDNGDMGAYLDNCLENGGACGGIGNITVSQGSFRGDGAQDYGLMARSRGSILLTNVAAMWNNIHGAILNNQLSNAYGLVIVQGLPASFAKFNENGGAGLAIESKQAIILNYVDASRNGGNEGAYLENNATGSLAPVSVTEGTFQGNNSEGLNVFSNGTISLYQVWANNNGQGGSGAGAHLVNDGASYPMPVTITFAGFWGNTGGSGLWVISRGFISLYGVSAGNNGDHGIYLDNQTGTASGVNVIGVGSSPNSTTGDISNNGEQGISINSKGAAYVSNYNIHDNPTGIGLYIDTGTSAYGSATLTTVYMDNNSYHGLYVLTCGAVTWTTGRANGNGWGGANPGVEINNQGSAYPMPVTLTGIEIHNNAEDGLSVLSKGAITLMNASIENNVEYGAELDNSAGSASMVYLYNASLNYNGHRGLQVVSKGFIMLFNAWAEGNANQGGMSLVNNGSAYPMGVTITRGGTSNNQGGTGLYISSTGYITLVDLSSNNNPDGCGAHLINNGGLASGITFIGGSWGNSFNDNGSMGFEAYSSGPVTLFNLDASDNGDNGLYVYNQYGYGGPVYIAGTLPGWTNTYSNNGDMGIVVGSLSSITLYNVEADQNTWGGAHLDNYSAVYNFPVSVTNGRFTENQNGDGLHVESRGAVTITNVDAERNSVDWNGQATVVKTYRDHLAGWDSDGDSWWLYVPTPTVLTIAMDVVNIGIDPHLYLYDASGTLLFSDDDGGGVLNALINTVVAQAAGWYRIEARQDGTGVDGEYLLAINDPGKGLDRDPARNIYVNNESWNGSAYTGVGAVYINGSYVNTNFYSHAAGTGVWVETNGGLLMNYVDSSANGDDGIYLVDHSSLASYWTYIRCDDNAGSGIDAVTSGSVLTLYRGEFNSNGDLGLSLINSTGSGASFTSLTNVLANNNEHSDGIHLESRGPVNLTNIEANGNWDNGVQVDNTTSSSGYVFILGQYNGFNGNNYSGLVIFSNGAILVMNTDANDSTFGRGAYLDNDSGSGGVTMQGFYSSPSRYSSFSGNHLNGLLINSNGVISLYNVRAEDNDDIGAQINNSNATIPAAVTISQSHFNYNPNSNGLNIYSRGAITLSSVWADSNGDTGAYLDNSTYAWTVPQGVTIFNSSFMGSVGSGLHVVSKGNILGYTINASMNGQNGAYLDNRESGSTGTISLYGIYGTNNFNYNTLDGLYVESNAAVTLYDLVSMQNEDDGVEVLTTATVTISQSNFTDNQYDGMDITSSQLLTLSFLTSQLNGQSWNDSDGIHVVSNGANVNLGYSTITGSFGNGIDATLGGGTLTLTLVNCVGNDLDADQAPDSQDNVYRH